jgi:hypothetical protein
MHPIGPSEEKLPGESWLDMRERTKPEREMAQRECEANARLIAAAPLMHMALEAHAAWHWAESTTGASTFHERMELANYSQWLTARALAQAAGLPHTEDFSGVPRMLIGFDGVSIDRASEKTAQEIVDRLIGDYRAAIAKATNTPTT